MPGNSQRKGAMRKAGTKKGAQVGSGGQRRKGLEGRGPTPKASDRYKHVASRRGQSSDKPAGGRRPRSKSSNAPDLLVGRNPVVEALRAEIPVTALYVAERTDMDDRVREAISTCAERGLPIQEVSRGELDRLTDGALHQGIGLGVPPYQYAEVVDLLDAAIEAGQAPLLVALDGVQDPRNLGAVVRSAAAFGAHGVIVPERRAAGMTPTAWRTSAGAAARVPVAQVTNLSRAIVALQKAGVFVIGLAADGDVPLEEFTGAEQPLCIVVGSEGKGLSRLVGEKCDQLVSIPMAGDMESLNASVAAAVALWHAAAERKVVS